MAKKNVLFLSAIVVLILPLILFLQYVFASEESKIVYITFDDGPTLNTPDILKTLDEYGAKATFFVLEERIVAYPEYIKQIIHSGNSVGLHGVSHSEQIYSTETSPLEEMEKTNFALENLTGIRSKLVRVPFGSSYKMTKKQAENLHNNGYIMWDWNVDPRDSVGKIIPERVLSNLKKGLSGCKGTPVILFHDRKSTAKLLPAVLDYLSKDGYVMLPISEKQSPVCFKLKN